MDNSAAGDGLTGASPDLDDRLFESFFAISSDCLFLAEQEPDGRVRFIAVNDAFLRVTGLLREQVLSRTIDEVIPEPARSFVTRKYREALDTNRPVEWTEVSTYPAGRLTGHVTLFPLVDRTDRRRLIAGAVRDMTALQREQAFALEQGLHRQALFQHVLDAILIADDDGRFHDVNPAACALLGYTSDELLARSLWDITDAAAHPGLRAQWQRLLTSGDATGEYVLRTRDGAALQIEFNAVAGVTPGRHLLVNRDVTARRAAEETLRESERRYRTIISNAPLAFFLIDRHGVFTLCEGKGLQATGLSPDAIVGRSAFELFESVEVHEESGRVTNGADVIRRVLAGETIRGRTAIAGRHFENSFIPARDEAGKVIGEVGVAFDVTERRMLEEQLRQAQRLESIGQLAGGIAHDFNNMLTVIHGYTDLLLDQLGPDHTIRPDLEEIRKAGGRAATLTYQLLAFSRKQVLQAKLLNLNETVSDVEKMLNRLIGEHIILRTHLEPSLGLVNADPGQIAQVLMNIAVNARDAMPDGGRLEIETSNVSVDDRHPSTPVVMPPGPYTLLVMRDTGAGMDEPTRARIFEPFFTTKPVGKGTGMGMATVYGIVKQSGGFIWVDSEPEKGTTFRIYLPHAAGLVERPATAAAESIPPGDERILLVEDEPLVRKLTSQVLRSCGYTVLEAADGREALRLFADGRCPVDLLLTDVVMPHTNGRVLADSLLAQCPDLRVIFMSGYADDAILQPGAWNGHTNFLHKPFTAQQLATAVRGVLDSLS